VTAATCEQIGAELVAFLDGELADGERRPVATHVATCLVCRRELERLTATQRLVSGLAAIEPASDFGARFWQRLEAEPMRVRRDRRSRRALDWALPALAAAAVLTVALQFLLTPAAPPTRPGTRERRIVQAPEARPKTAAAVAKDSPTKPAAGQLANVNDLRPEDVPPELRDHPELFLRLPVVRRLQTLEHFEAVRQEHGDGDGAG
jgi:anti-sigma factor RsiW